MTIDSQPDTHRSGIGEQENTGGSQDRPEPAGEPGQSTARTYDKQWPVKGYGYWRNTWYPSKQEHRQQFVYVPSWVVYFRPCR